MTSQNAPTLPPSSSHRLPTVSAADALQGLHARGVPAVSTGLSRLNKFLCPPGLPGNSSEGGLVRGKVTEVYGPSGVGKTAFGIQAAVNALREGQNVVWVEAGTPLVSQRLDHVLRAHMPQGTETAGRFHHLAAPTVAHLLALFVHPPAAFPPPNTTLIVIDSLSTLFDNAYPRNVDDRASRNANDHTRWAAGRKLSVINELISTLARLAAMHNIALLLACQTITRIRGSSRALLVPAISSAEWENYVSTRLVLFRDWVPGQGKSTDTDADRLQRARYIGVVKANGVTLTDEGGVGNVVPFAIESTGLRDISNAAVDIAVPALHPPEARPPKRRFTEIDDSEDENPDSDELYGWIDADEVAAEGLLIDEATSAPHEMDTAAAEHSAASQADRIPQKEGEEVSPKCTAAK